MHLERGEAEREEEDVRVKTDEEEEEGKDILVKEEKNTSVEKLMVTEGGSQRSIVYAAMGSDSCKQQE